MSDPSFASLIPVFVTLIVALTVRNVLVGLFSGVFVGAAMVADTSALLFVPTLVRHHIVPEVADTYNASVLVLLVFIGGFVKLIEFSGGGTAFAAVAARWVAGKARAQLASWAGGIMIFFSDLGTPLIVGPVFQPLTDRLNISRQKLAFILDSTSSPVAILIPFIGWGVFIMSVIADAFSAADIEMSEWDAFVSAIPFQLYAWLAIAMVPALTLLKFDYGSMAVAERNAAMNPPSEIESPEADHSNAKPILVWLPLLVLGLTLFATLNHYGFPFEQVAGSDFRAGLSAAYFLAAVVLVVLMVSMRVQGLLSTFGRYIDGMTGMMPIAATLVLAWTLGSVSETLGTGAYVAELARNGLPSGLLPAVAFLLAAIISFATGSSWGTIIIMMPLAIPAAIATGAPLPIVIGAVLSGGLFGDHSSPISETTILSATGAGTTPLEHFRTQLPYALTNGAIAFFGFIVAGLTQIDWILLLVVTTQFATLWLLRSRQSKVDSA
ncbi:MAG: sodium:proton exchanger [Woeseia sp.]|jgi:Na+/H+ antiporter NhaC|nr:sodium:proton exchanger [Woeseia sp.]MBT6208582.1 sodium:proton exchanger [Woeseia sp.]